MSLSGADAVAAVALVSLPCMTAPRLNALLGRFGDPVAALAGVQRGEAADLLRRRAADEGPVRAGAGSGAGPGAAGASRLASLMARRGTHVWVAGDDDYPIRDDVPLRPAVLLGEGEHTGVLDSPRVAIVGTRAATPHGLADARELGAALTEAGVTVVSGLAIGIDAAAHEGALAACRGPDAGPVGVVATGLDVVYPRRHHALFDRVRRDGLVVGEVGYGVGPAAWRFPVRNRIIAALADVVVVVEATAAGGARITAEYAAQYGRPVLAAPGSRRNPAAAGCNALLADGAYPLLEPSDVLVALGLVAGGRGAGWAPPAAAVLSTDARVVAHALGGEPATSDQVAGRTGLDADRVSAALRELERAGRLERNRGLLWPR